MRLALTSDLHGHLPKVPDCDLLLVAGDLALDKFKKNHYRFPDPEGQNDWLEKEWIEWLVNLDCEVLATLGNHDWPKRSYEHLSIYRDKLIELNEDLRIWFSPWSPTFGGWSYMLSEPELEEYYKQIPEGTEIIVSHGPPYGYGDKSYITVLNNADPHAGSKALLACIERVKPKLVVCGHIHGGFGTYKVEGMETVVMNVSLVDEAYNPTNEVVVIDF